MKTCGEEDAISHINGSVGERGNEKLVPAWVGAARVRSQRSGHGKQSTRGKRRGGKVSELGSLSMQLCTGDH